jgi:hypothetical protein
MVVDNSIGYLGKKVKDKIGGTKGIVTSVCFDLYGCIQVVVDEQKRDKEGTSIRTGWIDINRLEVLNHKPIMRAPDFNNKYSSIEQVGGPAEKPSI